MIFGATAFGLGQLVGLAILVLLVIGVVQLVVRGDLTWREKLLGKKDDRARPPDTE